jgi:sodium-dependent dicarboxylate transporter 2/3/5
MSLPISTPPNALAHATGYTDTRGMAITGVVMGILGLIVSWIMMIFLAKIAFFGTPAPKAAEAVPAAPAAVEKVVETPAASAVADSAAAPAVADTAAVVAADSTVAAPAVDSAAKVEVADTAAAK